MFTIFQYAAVYVKKHLIDTLVAKIKALKLLSYKNQINGKESLVKTLERLLTSKGITKPLLNHLGMTLNEFKKVSPEAELFKEVKTNEKPAASTVIDSCLVMSPRVKLIEEFVPCNNKNEEKVDPTLNEGHAHSDMLSPYSNLPPRSKSHSKSPRRQMSIEETSCEKDITDYLNNKGEIQYADLLTDSIASVDEKLLKSSKKDGQVGGSKEN